MPGTGPRAKHWCFTLNNYTPDDVDRLSAEERNASTLEDVEYIIFGREIGDQGTSHLQGTVCFQSRKRLPQAILIIGQAHFSITRNLSQSITYCKKDGDFTEIGEPPVDKDKKAGRMAIRNDLEDFKASVKEDNITDMKTLREMHSDVCAKYPRFVKEYIDDYKKAHTVECHLMKPWQEALFHRLILEPQPREIIFIVDKGGNQGKTWLCRYYCDLHPSGQIIVPGKKADMAYIVREDARVFFLDCPRSKQGEFIQYDFLEELKNGYIFSPKYESRIKLFATPHVVVFMNENPDMSKLSLDRYSITTLSDD